MNKKPVKAKKSWKDDPKIKKIWDNDKLDRMKSAERLTQIVSNYHKSKIALDEDESLTLIVKSPWGTGKTYFVKKWMETMQRQQAFCVYFSAWEAEIHKSPAIYFMQTFVESLDKQKSYLKRFVDAVKKGVLKLTPILLSVLSFTWIAQGSFEGILATPAFDAIRGKCQGILDELKNIENSPVPIKDARKYIGDLVNALAGGADRKIFIFIDELDRCKPDFAVKILEEMKHFFSLKNLVFVLSVDFGQLEGSIKHVYGSHIDCEGYLMRFIKLFYTLSPANDLQYAEFLSEKIIDMPDTLLRMPHCIGELGTFTEFFASFSQSFKASLRDQQILMRRLELMLAAGQVFLLPTLYFLFVQFRYPALWEQAVRSDLTMLIPDKLNYYLENRQEQIRSQAATVTSLVTAFKRIPQFKLDLSARQEALLIDFVEILNTKALADKKIAFTERQSKYSGDMHSPGYECFKSASMNLKDFLKQVELINLYSEGFGGGGI